VRWLVARLLLIERATSCEGGLVRELGSSLRRQSILLRKVGLGSQTLRLLPLAVGGRPGPFGRCQVFGRGTLGGAALDEVSDRARSKLFGATRLGRRPASQGSEDPRKLWGVVVTAGQRAKAGRVQLSVERAAPESEALVCAAGSRCLEGGPDPPQRVFAGGVVAASTRLDGRADGSLDKVAKAP
jgi:hypothetical protein